MKDQWSQDILKASNDPELLDLLSRILVEQEEAKRMLRVAGFGVTGQGLLATVKEVVESLAHY